MGIKDNKWQQVSWKQIETEQNANNSSTYPALIFWDVEYCMQVTALETQI